MPRKKTKTPEAEFSDARGLLAEMDRFAYFHPHEALDGGVALPSKVIEGDPDSKVILLLGANATGKSFWRRLAQATAQMCEPKVEPIRVSMQDRTGQGGIYGPMVAMMYGAESHRSTGENSAHTVIAGFNTCRGRTSPHIFVLDEPDIGCSEEVAAGIGLEIAEAIPTLTEQTRAVVVVSHSRGLLAELAPLQPHLVWLGEDAGESLDDWLNREVVPLRPKELAERSNTTFKRIQAILNYYKE